MKSKAPTLRQFQDRFPTEDSCLDHLMRVRYGPFSLPPNLKRGKTLELEVRDVEKLLADFNMEVPEVTKSPTRSPRKVR